MTLIEPLLRYADTEIVVIPATPTFTVPTTQSKSPNGTAVPPLANLAGQGISIEKFNQNSICLDINITAAAGVGVINADVHWFYSNDNVDWYYMATYNITESISATNPSGFVANAGTAKRLIAQPVGAFNKYVCIAVRNNDANSIIVTARLVKQIG